MADSLEISKDAVRTAGSAIHGEKILTQARKYIPKAVTKGSSTHNIQRYDLVYNAYAVITKPLRLLVDPKHKPKS